MSLYVRMCVYVCVIKRCNLLRKSRQTCRRSAHLCAAAGCLFCVTTIVGDIARMLHANRSYITNTKQAQLYCTRSCTSRDHTIDLAVRSGSQSCPSPRLITQPTHTNIYIHLRLSRHAIVCGLLLWRPTRNRATTTTT